MATLESLSDAELAQLHVDALRGRNAALKLIGPAAEQEHGVRWNGFGPEPMTDSEWLARLRELSDSDLDELCNTSFERERDAARDERDRRIDAGVWRSDA